MRVLILAAGDTPSIDTSYPLILEEFDGVPHIEHVISKCKQISGAELVVAARSEDLDDFSLAEILRLLDPKVNILSIESPSAGAACTALLAGELFKDDEELLILGMTEVLDKDFAEIINQFRSRNLDAGTVVFPSYHPRYSYVRLNAEGHVIQAEEKYPISHTATASFYWFRRADEFIDAAKSMIRKGADVDGMYYVCPTFNEFVLIDKKVGVFNVASTDYHPLKTIRQIERYEQESTHTGEIVLPARGKNPERIS